MIEKTEIIIGFVLTLLAGAGAWFEVKSDIRSTKEKQTAMDANLQTLNLTLVAQESRLKELELINSQATEHRAGVLRRLDRMEEDAEKREEKTDRKLDALMTGVAALRTTVEERTKQLHS